MSKVYWIVMFDVGCGLDLVLVGVYILLLYCRFVVVAAVLDVNIRHRFVANRYC